MGLRIYTISDTNPNVAMGGSGCVCSEYGGADCNAPFAVFHGVDMLSPYSPHCVICAACLKAAASDIDNGETQVEAIDTTGEEVVVEDGPEV